MPSSISEPADPPAGAELRSLSDWNAPRRGIKSSASASALEQLASSRTPLQKIAMNTAIQRRQSAWPSCPRNKIWISEFLSIFFCHHSAHLLYPHLYCPYERVIRSNTQRIAALPPEQAMAKAWASFRQGKNHGRDAGRAGRQLSAQTYSQLADLVQGNSSPTATIRFAPCRYRSGEQISRSSASIKAVGERSFASCSSRSRLPGKRREPGHAGENTADLFRPDVNVSWRGLPHAAHSSQELQTRALAYNQGRGAVLSQLARSSLVKCLYHRCSSYYKSAIRTVWINSEANK